MLLIYTVSCAEACWCIAFCLCHTPLMILHYLRISNFRAGESSESGESYLGAFLLFKYALTCSTWVMKNILFSSLLHFSTPHSSAYFFTSLYSA